MIQKPTILTTTDSNGTVRGLSPATVSQVVAMLQSLDPSLQQMPLYFDDQPAVMTPSVSVIDGVPCVVFHLGTWA